MHQSTKNFAVLKICGQKKFNKSSFWLRFRYSFKQKVNMSFPVCVGNPVSGDFGPFRSAFRHSHLATTKFPHIAVKKSK